MSVAAKTLWIAAALALAGCAMPDMESFRAPDMSMFRPATTSVLRDSAQRAVTAEDLVDGQGNCPAAMAAVEPGAGQAATASVPLVPAGVALDMTECDVVRRAGVAEKVDLGTNERGERTATLTYIRGPRPGIYHFTAGRLTSMERAPEPPAPARPARPQRQQRRAT